MSMFSPEERARIKASGDALLRKHVAELLKWVDLGWKIHPDGSISPPRTEIIDLLAGAHLNPRKPR